MRQIKIVFFLLTVSLIAVAQDAAPAQPPAQAQSKQLQQQIADLKKANADQQAHIRALEEAMRQEMRDESAADQQTKSAVRMKGLAQGAGLGAGAMLLVFGLSLRARKQSYRSAPTKPQARAASA